jgi:bacteriorhodopsin
MTACIAYFTMGSNLGWTPIDVEWLRSAGLVAGKNREIFYTRYVNWLITTPLLLMGLLLTAVMPWPSITWTIFLDWVMNVTGLIGALVKTRCNEVHPNENPLLSYHECSWLNPGFYAFGCAAMFGIFYELAGPTRSHARALGWDMHRVFFLCSVILFSCGSATQSHGGAWECIVER